MLGILLAAALLPGPLASTGVPRGASLAHCDQAVETAPDKRESWGCYYDHARIYGDWEATASALRAQLGPVEATDPGPRTLGYARLALANVVVQLDLAEGIEVYEQAADELERGDDPLALTLTLLNLAYQHRVAGDPSSSATDLRRAEQSAARFGDPRWIAAVKVERVRHMLRTTGDLGRAARLLAQTEPLLFPDGDYQAQLHWLAASMSVYRGLGQLARARALVDRHVTLVAAADDRYVEATVRYNRIGIQLEQAIRSGEDRPSAGLLEEVERALAVADEGSNRWAAVSLRVLHSGLLLVSGSADRAETLARRGVTEARELGDARLEIDAMLALVESIVCGDVPLHGSRVVELEALLDEAMARARAAGDATSELEVLGAATEVRWALGPREQAIAQSELGLEALERLRSDQRDPTTRAEVQGALAGVFERYVDLLLREAQADPSARDMLIAKAFEVGERFRARVLRESLRTAGASRAAVPEVLEQLDAVQRRLSDPGLPTAQRVEQLDELERLERLEMETLEQRQPEPLDHEALPSLARVQQVLGAREALLVFHMPELRELDPRRRKSAWVLVITSQRAEAIELPSRAEILPRVAMLGPLVERRDQDIDAAAAKLGSLLLDDALAVLPEAVDTLSMVLDGPLHRVPLASLRVGSERRPLVEHFAVGAVPSASLLVQWRDGRTSPSPARPSPALLALADPPVPFITDGSGPAVERAASLTEGLALLPLPQARREAELAAQGPQDTLWVGAQASETALDRLPLDDFGVLHFATHAVIDERHPGRSAVVLAGDDGDGSDGLLQPRDIAGLDLAGKLVVLSACSTARGHVVAGEGVMGLAHAMFGAGAHTVVASLWPLRDDDGLALFRHFYPYLEAGDDVATALRKAQHDRAAEGAPPAAWAGVVVLGDPHLVPFPGGREEAAVSSGEAGSLGGSEALLLLLGLGLVVWGAWPRGSEVRAEAG